MYRVNRFSAKPPRTFADEPILPNIIFFVVLSGYVMASSHWIDNLSLLSSKHTLSYDWFALSAFCVTLRNNCATLRNDKLNFVPFLRENRFQLINRFTINNSRQIIEQVSYDIFMLHEFCLILIFPSVNYFWFICASTPNLQFNTTVYA